MKVLQINSVCGIRSTGRICTDIADVLLQANHECKIAYGRLYVPQKYKNISIKIGSRLDVAFHYFLSTILGRHGFGSRGATKAFIREIKKFSPDIIHIHNIHGHYLNLPLLFDYLKQSDAKVVWTLHDGWTMTGACAFFSNLQCEHWYKNDCRDCVLKTRFRTKCNAAINYQKKKYMFSNLNNANLVTPSYWLADMVKKSFLNHYPLQVIYNGVQQDAFHPNARCDAIIKQKNLLGKRILLGVASPWSNRKGLNDFLNLSKILSSEYQIVLVGLSEKQIEALPNNITGLTKTDDVHELAGLYASATAFLNLTYADNFPTTNIEALSCGTPVITYRTGGSPEAIDETCGWVVEQGDLKTIVEIVSKIDKDHYIDACVKRAMLFDKRCMAENYFSLYRRLVK